ncbi:MAG: hypothetical protein L6R40_000231 [Gallowayella cf. fulva]|nr:MAG: hypothetical protein L6R40_000231 [Xanthomendoza cf. fulva]
MLSRWLLSMLLFDSAIVQALKVIKLRGLPPNSGNEQEEDYVCLNPADCSEKGIGYWNKLHTTISDPKAADRSEGAKLFATHYRPEFADSVEAPDELQQGLRDRNMDTDGMDIWDVIPYNPDTETKEKTTPYYNLFNTHTGVIIAVHNSRAQDHQKRLEWSEIMYQTWQHAKAQADLLAAEGEEHSPGGPISNLRSVVQHIVTNKGTQAIIRNAYEANRWVPGKDKEWREWSEANTRPFFFAILGTDNVKGTLWLLNDHAVEIGRKEISSVWTRWQDNLDIWIDIVPAQWAQIS